MALERSGNKSRSGSKSGRNPAKPPVVAPWPHATGVPVPAIPRELIPEHVAIVMDGNGRWANERGLPRIEGHKAGEPALLDVMAGAIEMGIKYISVYAFSTENWKRSKDEVDGLMKLFRSYMKKCIKLADKNKMRVRVIGEVSAFDQDIQESIARLEQYSQKYDEIYFQIALNYVSRFFTTEPPEMDLSFEAKTLERIEAHRYLT